MIYRARPRKLEGFIVCRCARLISYDYEPSGMLPALVLGMYRQIVLPFKMANVTRLWFDIGYSAALVVKPAFDIRPLCESMVPKLKHRLIPS